MTADRLSLGFRLPHPAQSLLKRLPGGWRLFREPLGRPGGTPPVPGALRHIVYLPTWLSWDRMRERPHHVLSALATAGHDVSFVDLASTRRADRGVHIDSDLRRVPPTGVIIYMHYAPHVDHLERFSESVVVYDILDDLTLYEDASAAAAGHALLMDRADVVIVSSEVLAERHRAERPDLVVVPNGVDLAAFTSPGPRPHDLGKGTVIGYHGAVERWFDFELLTAVAETRPDWSFVVVGPVGSEVRAQADAAEERHNIAFIGERSPQDIASYVAAFDVSAIWFTVDAMTAAVSPLKMFESLAAGTPVVSVPLPAAVAESAVRTAADSGDFVAQIEAALGGPPPQPMPGADWNSRVRLLTDALEARGVRSVAG